MTKKSRKLGPMFSVTVAPYAAASGAGMLVDSTFGVAACDIASGGAGEIETEGTHELVKVTGTAWTEGMKIYWDDSAKKATHTSNTGANKQIGTAEGAAASAAAIGWVRLSGVVI